MTASILSSNVTAWVMVIRATGGLGLVFFFRREDLIWQKESFQSFLSLELAFVRQKWWFQNMSSKSEYKRYIHSTFLAMFKTHPTITQFLCSLCINLISVYVEILPSLSRTLILISFQDILLTETGKMQVKNSITDQQSVTKPYMADCSATQSKTKIVTIQ